MYCVSLLNYNELIFNHISFVHSLSQKEITYVFQFVDTLGDNSMASETPNRINANTNIMIVMTMWWELIVKGKNIISYLVLDIFKFGNYYMWISIFRLAYFIVVIMHNCNFTSCLYYRHNYAQLRFCVLCMLSSQLRTIAILRLVYFFVAITLNCDFSSCAILPWQLHIILMTDTSKTFMRNQLQHILVYLHLDKLLFYVLFNHIYIYIYCCKTEWLIVISCPTALEIQFSIAQNGSSSLIFCVVFCISLFVLFLLAIVLSVLLRFADFDWHFW